MKKIVPKLNAPNRYIEQVSQGSSFIIAKSGKPLAKLIPLSFNNGNGFRFGTMRGMIKIADDFDAPLADDLLDLFEAGL